MCPCFCASCATLNPSSAARIRWAGVPWCPGLVKAQSPAWKKTAFGKREQQVWFPGETVIVGIQPEVAFAMVQLGLTLGTVETALDLEEGLAYLNEKARRRRPSGR